LALFVGLLAILGFLLWPMVPSHGIPQPESQQPTTAVVPDDLPPPPADTATAVPQDPSGGLKAFLQRWEMNDFLFMLLAENLKPTAEANAQPRAWFIVVPETCRRRWMEGPARWLRLDPSSTAFLATRFITSTILLLVALGLVWSTRLSDRPTLWLRAAFLTLAWLWLLSPTQNPWYWIWALPLVTFARSRAWLAMSGLTLIYYLRFWLAHQWPELPALGMSYRGTVLFDFVVTWLEFGPWFVWLGVESWRNRGVAPDLPVKST
jgi:hypothetical protein